MVTFHANIYGPLDRGMAALQLCLLEVFTQRNFVAGFIRLNLTFTQKKRKIALCRTVKTGDVEIMQECQVFLVFNCQVFC